MADKEAEVQWEDRVDALGPSRWLQTLVVLTQSSKGNPGVRVAVTMGLNTASVLDVAGSQADGLTAQAHFRML